MFTKALTLNPNDIVINGEQVSETTPIRLYIADSSWEKIDTYFGVLLENYRSITYFNNIFYAIQPYGNLSGWYNGLYEFSTYDSALGPITSIEETSINNEASMLCVFKNALYFIDQNKIYRYNDINRQFVYVINLPNDLSNYTILPIAYDDHLYIIYDNNAYIWDGTNTWDVRSNFIPYNYAYDNGCIYNGDMYINFQDVTMIYDGSNWELEDKNWDFGEYEDYEQKGIFVYNDWLMNYGIIHKNNEAYFVIFRLEDDDTIYRIYSITDDISYSNSSKLIVFNPSISGFIQCLMYFYPDVITGFTGRQELHNYYSLKKGDK